MFAVRAAWAGEIRVGVEQRRLNPFGDVAEELEEAGVVGGLAGGLLTFQEATDLIVRAEQSQHHLRFRQHIDDAQR